MKRSILIVLILFIASISNYSLTSHIIQISDDNFIQTNDTTAKVQFRRGVEVPPGYFSYEEKYTGKNMLEEKRKQFPLDYYNTDTGVWTELSPGIPRVAYAGVSFINPDTGWISGDLGALIKTTDGGENWITAETPTTNPLLKVDSYNGEVVIAGGYNGLIVRSSDGGETFEEVESGVGTGRDFWGLQMLNDTLGWICGRYQTLLKTTDAGLTWQMVNPGLNEHYWSLDFLNENYGMIACGGGKILKTTDGGENWSVHQAGDATELFSIDIIDQRHIAAAGFNGKNVYSSDAGVTWIQNQRLQHDEVNCIRFVNRNTGYIVGIWNNDSWGIRKTTNRGVTWYIPEVGNLSEYEMDLLPNGIGYSVGSNLNINKTTGGYDNWSGLFLNADFVDVYFTGEQTGYAADGRYFGGPLYKTTDGGENWFSLPNFPSDVFTSSLRCITFTDSLTGFAGSSPCRIVKSTDAGESWYVVNRTGLTDTIGLINKFFFINQTTGWAVTTRGGILKTTDAGENWFMQREAGVHRIFKSLYFVDSLYGWVSGSNGRPFKTTDGGNNWIRMTNLDFWNTYDVFFVNKDIGWITDVYAENDIYKTTNGGISWEPETELSQVSNFNTFTEDNHFWVYGSSLYETTNYGQNWQEITPSITIFNQFCAPTNWLGYGVGYLGYIIKYYDSTFVPVELISFYGNIIQNNIHLKWKTASELNNRGFFVERSVEKWKIEDGKWETVSFVEGAGTTTEPQSYSFIDKSVPSGKYQYRLKQIDIDGSFEYSKIIEVEVGTPIEFYLSQNYPNPFNPITTIEYKIPEQSFVNISLFDITGRKIKELINEKKEPGKYTLKLKGGNLSSGVYFYRLKTSGGFTAVKKLTIIK